MTAALLALCMVTKPVAIENVKVEVGDGSVIESATVVIDGGVIKTVGPKAKAPSSAERIDGTGKVIAPGFIEVLTRLGLFEVNLEASTRDFTYDGPTMVPGFRAADGFNQRSVRIPIGRRGGVTSAIAVPGGRILHGTGVWFDLTGELKDAPDPNQPTAMYGKVDGFMTEENGGSRGAVWLQLRQAFDDARFWQKNRAAVERGAARKLSLSPLHLEALVPVLDRKIPLVLHVYRASDILTALRFARDQNIRLILSGAAEAHLVAKQIVAARVPVILKPTDQTPWGFDALYARDDAPALLARAGVQLILTAYDWDNNVSRVRQEAGIAVAYGLDHAEAIRAITETPARVFGRSNVGVVKAGKSANLVLWSGDPLEVRSTVERMWIDGAPQSLDTRQLQLVRRYRQR